MLPNDQLLNENVAEYILLMYQMEDLARAYDLDLDRLMEEYFLPQLNDDERSEEYRQWFQGLIVKMKRSGLNKQGHIPELNEVMVELSYLHNTLLNLTGDNTYSDIYQNASRYIDEFKERSDLGAKNQIEIAFHALYMKLLLRLQRKEISQDTEEAFDAMRKMLVHLAGAYRKMKQGELNFLQN
jgi:hypothetical protein